MNMTRQQREFWRSLAVLTLACALAACAVWPPGHEETSQSWHEEVQLQDGRVIVVERTEFYSAYCGPGIRCGLERRGPPTRSKIEFVHNGEAVTWEEQMAPMILQVEQKQKNLVLVATFASCGQYRRYSKSDRSVPAYIAFRYLQGTWREIKVDKLQINLESNLLVNDAKFGSSTTLREKQEWNAVPGLGAGYLRVYSKRNIARQCFGG